MNKNDYEVDSSSVGLFSASFIVALSWNEIFTVVSPHLVTTDTESNMEKILVNFMKKKYEEELENLLKEDNLAELYGFKLDELVSKP